MLLHIYLRILMSKKEKYVLEGVFTELCPIHCHCYLNVGWGKKCVHQIEWEKEQNRKKVIKDRKRKIKGVF